jgi:hypothetical protein
MAQLPKKDAPTPEIIREESSTFVARKSKTPVKTGKVEKAFVNDQLIDVEVTSRYPRNAQSANYNVEVISPMTSLPMVRISPVGWVGPAPLQIPETRLDELIELLSKVR